MIVRNNKMTVFEVSLFIWMEALNFSPYLCNLLYSQAFMMCPWQVIYCPLCTLHAHCYMLKAQLTRMHLCCILDKFRTPKGSLTPVFLCLCSETLNMLWIGWFLCTWVLSNLFLHKRHFENSKPLGPTSSDGNESNIFQYSFTLSM
jgi:hypothetical protein